MATVLILSDLHVGSTVSLCKPVVTLDDGGQYRISPGQGWLWRCWNEMLEQVDKRKSGDLYVIINGDAIEGDTKNRSLQLISRNPATITSLAAEILEPLARTATGVFFIRGTGRMWARALTWKNSSPRTWARSHVRKRAHPRGITCRLRSRACGWTSLTIPA